MSQDLRGKRVAIYARYSSENQRESSIQDQVRRCTEHVRMLGGEVSNALVFTDSAISGATMNRPALERLIMLATRRPPSVDFIVTEDMSRISRDFADSALIFKKLTFARVPLLGVADGIDTGARGAKMTFALKGLMNDSFLDDLRDKTRRGMQGRALAGLSTGALPFGFTSRPITDAYGKVSGHEIEIHPERADVVRGMFAAYLDGMSLSQIAHDLIARGIESPRAHTRHTRKGWSAETVRAMLRNEKYIGCWSYGRSTWTRDPVTHAHVKRSATSEPITVRKPELAIVDDAMFAAVAARTVSARTFYRGGDRIGAVPQKKTEYPLSSLLTCSCGAPMIVYNSKPARYRCAAYEKRKACTNSVSFLERDARSAILGAIRERLSRPAAIEYARKKMAEMLGADDRAANAELRERRDRLSRHESRIKGLVSYIADGDRSDAVTSGLKDLESAARQERDAISAIEARGRKPIVLPSIADVRAAVTNVEAAFDAAPVRAREAMRALLQGGSLVMTARPDRSYLVEGRVYPLAITLYNSGSSAGPQLL